MENLRALGRDIWQQPYQFLDALPKIGMVEVEHWDRVSPPYASQASRMISVPYNRVSDEQDHALAHWLVQDGIDAVPWC